MGRISALREAELREKQGILAMLNTVIEHTEFAMTCGDPWCRAMASSFRYDTGVQLKQRFEEIEAKYALAYAQEAANE